MLKPKFIALIILYLLVGCSFISKSSGGTESLSSTKPILSKRDKEPIITMSEVKTTTTLKPFLITPSPTKGKIPTVTLSPTLLLHTVTPIVTNTQIPSAMVMKYHCLDIYESVPISQTLQGVQVYKNEDNSDAFLWDLKTGSKDRFNQNENDRLYDFEVSPDGKRVLYRKASKTGYLTIMATSDGQITWTDPIGYGWFDNEHLASVEYSKEGILYLVLLNPITGNQQELHPDFPNIYFGQYPFDPDWRGLFPVYDPTLTRVVYPETRGTHSGGGSPVILWDIEKKKELARLVTMDDHYGNTPIWAIDGSQVIMAMMLVYNSSDADEFYSISRDGAIRQLTHFMDHYSATKIFNSYSLSPDGRLVAFWIEAKPDNQTGARLAVLDINTGNVTNYCIENTTPDITVVPIWSPNSKQLLLNLPDPTNEAQRYAVIVDMANDWAAKVINDMEPVGWMASP